MSDDTDDKRDGAPDLGGDIKPIAITDEMKKSYLCLLYTSRCV